MNNLYAEWCTSQDRERLEPYAFKCTAAAEGSDLVKDLRGLQRRYFVATTVELLTTGVDVPCVRNIVFFKYVRSPIAFYQMVGRGTRIDVTTGKLMFRVYDYTDATRLFGEKFRSRLTPPRKAVASAPGPEAPPPEKTILVEGFDVRVTDAGRFIVTSVDGKAMPVTIEEYKQRLAERLVAEAPSLEDFRARWISPTERRALMGRLPDAGRAPLLVRTLEDMADYDLYDVLAELGYGLAPRTRPQRAEAFTYKHERWLASLPPPATATLKALAGQFARSGTDGLESPQVFDTPDVTRAGGLAALKALGQPADILRQTKERLFAA
jgi:type I restriction enzyme R subunit